MHDTSSTRGLAYQRNVGPITSKQRSILGSPLDGQTLVIQTCIADSASSLESRPSKPAQSTKTIVDLDNNDAIPSTSLARLDQATRVLRRTTLRAQRIAPAVYPVPSISTVKPYHDPSTTHQSRTAAFFPPLLRLSKTFFGTATSRNKQSSVSAGFDTGALAPCKLVASCASAVVRLNAVALPSIYAVENSSPMIAQSGAACGQLRAWAPVCTVVFRPVGGTGALKRSAPTGGWAKRMLVKL